MRKITTLLLFLLLTVATVQAQQTNTNKSSTSVKKTGAGSMPDSASMMKAWTDYMTPGRFHESLAKDNGTWNEEVTMWMDPSAPPTKSTSTAVNTMIMGGRYQQSHHTGSINGMPFEGMSILGYDNARKVFITTWVDNMGTGIMTLEGKWDDKNQGITFKGKAVDPMTGKDMEVKQTFKKIDDNTQLVEMYNMVNGKEQKTMEIKLTRKA